MFAGELSETLLMLGVFINGIILYAKEKKEEIKEQEKRCQKN